MTDANFRSRFPAGKLDDRASAVTPGGQWRPTDMTPAELRHMAVARRLLVTTVVSVFALLAVAVLVVSIVAAGALPWMVGAVLALAVVGVIVLGVHAGGHGWFVPIPVLVLAAAWAVAVSAGSWRSPAAWVFAALAFLGRRAGSGPCAPRHRLPACHFAPGAPPPCRAPTG